MEHLILFILVWCLVLLLVPRERIKTLKYVPVVSILWMVFIDNLAAYLGYYHYENILIPIGRASLFHLLALAGVGILMVNWLDQRALSKLTAVLVVDLAFLLVQYYYIQRGALVFERFDWMLSFVFNTAALSIFMWVSIAVVGEEKLYKIKC